MKILLVGISTRALAESAVNAGYEVISLDFFGDSDQPASVEAYSLVRDFYQPPDLAALARTASQFLPRVDRVVVEAGLENQPLLLDFCPPEKRWGNTSDAVRACRDWGKLSLALHGTGLQLPLVVGAGRAVPTTGHFLLKDLAHSGGFGVSEWNGSTLPKEGEVLQEFIDGMLASACFVANGKDARLLGLTRQYAGVPELAAPTFAWCGNAAPLINPHIEDIILEAVTILAEEFGLLGLNGIDFIIRAGVSYLLEVNPRPPASFCLFERLLGINAFSCHVEACQGRFPPPLDRQKKSSFPAGLFWARGILYAPRDIQVGDTRSWSSQAVSDVPHPGEHIPAGAPLFSLFAKGTDINASWDSVLSQAQAWLSSFS